MDTYAALASGTVLEGRYRVGGLIARGGMSMVYRGVDTRLDRPVAIKVMSPQYVFDPAFLTRFEREARLAASLRHPGVVAVYDQGRDGDLVFLVMELVDGGTLRDLLRERGPLPVPVTLGVLEPLLAALGAAHAAGLVHRDVKPENVLISARGEIKVADFGLVRAVSSQTMATGDVILGTVAYLSPEQVVSGAADARSDVYATGIMAYEMLCGSPPFDGDTPMSVAYRHVHDDVPPVSLRRPGTPEALDRLVVAATRRDPAARPRDASAFLADLMGVSAQLGVPRVHVPVPVRHPAPVPHPVGVRPPGNPVSGENPGEPDHDPADDPADHPAADSSTTRVGPAVADPRETASGTVVVLPRPGAGGTGRGPGTLPESGSPAAGVAIDAHASKSPSARPGSAASRRRRRWLVAILVVILLGTAAAAGGWWLGGRWAATPAAVGLVQANAESIIRDAGLVPRVTVRHQDSVPAGTVASSDPVAGSRQLRGSEVALLVSSGPPVVPTITAGTAPDAGKAAISAAELTPVVSGSPAFDDTVPAGAVVRTDPAAGKTLTVGATVTLVLSGGPAPVTVPDVAGKTAEDAKNKLTVAGLTVGTPVKTFDASAKRGAVLGTSPAAGTTVTRGSPVSLRVAYALEVPDVRGSATKDAVRTMEKAGFTVTVGDPAFDADIDAGDILRTDPGPGTAVDPQNPKVFLVPSNAVTVPDLTAGSVAKAQRTLDRLGLKMSVSSLFGGDGSSVYDQNPGAGARVEPGGTVTISAFP